MRRRKRVSSSPSRRSTTVSADTRPWVTCRPRTMRPQTTGVLTVSDPTPKGRISSGVTEDAAALKTLEFIHGNLATWRDDPERPDAERERDLNSQLCKFLNVAARNVFPMVHFHHEESQGNQHSSDISADPLNAGWIEGRPYTKYDPILVLEGKRLPTPGSGRQREYVASATGAAPMGGIQRFKLALYGSKVSIHGMIGYIQQGSCVHWIAEVNHWIDDLASSVNSNWSSDDRLQNFKLDSSNRLSRCESKHSRISGVTLTVRLMHLWVEMSIP